MICYRLKHIPTGLYFVPVRELHVRFPFKGKEMARFVKSNFSRKGKIYTNRPSLGYLGKIVYTHQFDFTKLSEGDLYRDRNYIPVVEADWEIEEVGSGAKGEVDAQQR